MKKKIILFLFLTFNLLIGCKNDDTKRQTSDSILDNPVTEELSTQIKNSPNNPTLYVLRGGAYYEMEAFDRATADFQRATQMDSTNIDYLHFLADAYSKSERETDAMNTLQRAVRLRPKHVASLLKLAESQYLLGHYEAALANCQMVVRLEAKNANAWHLLGLNQQELGYSTQAIQSYKKAIASDSKHIESYISLGNLLANANEKEANDIFDKAVALDSTNIDALFAKADFLHYKQKEYKEAIKYYKQIGTIEPQESRAFLEAGNALMALQDYKLAYHFFDIATKNDPSYVDAYYFKAVAAEKMGDNKTAIRHYKQTLQFNPEHGAASAALEKLER